MDGDSDPPAHQANGDFPVNGDGIQKCKSFKEAVAGKDVIPKGALFAVSGVVGEVGSNDGGSCGGKPPDTLGFAKLAPNPAMKSVIKNERNRLRDTAIFFAAIDVNKIPARKYIDSWFSNVWLAKFGIQISYCRLLQRGLFVIFLKNNEMQSKTLSKSYWNVGGCVFRALAWTPSAIVEEVIALSCPRWVVVKDLPPDFWKLVPTILAPFGNVVRVDEAKASLLNLDTRALVSLNPGVELPPGIVIEDDEKVICCPLEVLGGINACYLCHKEGHIQRNCPVIKKNSGPGKTGFSGLNSVHSNARTSSESVPASSPIVDPLPKTSLASETPACDSSPPGLHLADVHLNSNSPNLMTVLPEAIVTKNAFDALEDAEGEVSVVGLVVESTPVNLDVVKNPLAVPNPPFKLSKEQMGKLNAQQIAMREIRKRIENNHLAGEINKNKNNKQTSVMHMRKVDGKLILKKWG